MLPIFRRELGDMLPDEIVFPYFAEREGAWLLHRLLAGRTRIADLRRGPLAPLLERPGVREVVSNCGDGYLSPHQLLPLADPLQAFGREADMMIDRATETAFDVACAAEWRQFSVSFTGWADDGRDGQAWRQLQLSRRGGNLVLQLNFPDAYRAAFLDIFGQDMRDRLDGFGHPVRRDGPITMAWARLDLDPWGHELLIEELQTDWLRSMKEIRALAGKRTLPPGARRLLDETAETYGKDWSRALMLSVLIFAVRELGISTVWMHQPRTGAHLKNIRGALPPRSIYTDVPRRFGFSETARAPELLYRTRSKAISNLRKAGKPLFWKLSLGEVVDGAVVEAA